MRGQLRTLPVFAPDHVADRKAMSLGFVPVVQASGSAMLSSPDSGSCAASPRIPGGKHGRHRVTQGDKRRIPLVSSHARVIRRRGGSHHGLDLCRHRDRPS